MQKQSFRRRKHFNCGQGQIYSWCSGTAHGDCEAFSALFQTHRARVYSVCLRMTNNTAQAEDLTQDAFLQVFRKLSTFKGSSALSTWLYRIAVNTVLMHYRRKGLKQISLDEPSCQDATKVRREYGDLDRRLSGAVDRITLNRVIRDLPPGTSGDRETVELFNRKF